MKTIKKQSVTYFLLSTEESLKRRKFKVTNAPPIILNRPKNEEHKAASILNSYIVTWSMLYNVPKVNLKVPKSPVRKPHKIDADSSSS